MKKLILVAFALLASVLMSGCDNNKAKELTGHWIQRSSLGDAPSELTIEYVKDHYAISLKEFDLSKAMKKKANTKTKVTDFSDCWHTNTFTGKAVSETEIKMDGESINYGKEKGVNILYYAGHAYVKK